MPSPKDPIATVNPGPGKLPAGTVTASSLLFTGGGGSAGLVAHITDPVDAHMASAIGVNPISPVTSLPLLSVVGGPVDGESVLDFIEQAKDLFPTRPNLLGAYDPTIPNSGIPEWDTWGGVNIAAGAWTNGGAAVFSHFILSSTAVTPGPYGKFFPADRGVLAAYRSTDGDFTNAGTTTLYAALWLGSTSERPTALTCPSADFNPALRPTGQLDHMAMGGLDQFALVSRVPASKIAMGLPPMDPFTFNFSAYQLAYWGLTLPAVAAGSNDSWLLVHWRETYAISDASIAPAAIAANYNSGNVYSEVPGNFNAVPVNSSGVQSLNRRYVYKDVNSGTVPSVASWSVSEIGVPSTVYLSGVAHYDNGTTPLAWQIDLRVNDLVGNSWLPGTTAGAELPADFVTGFDPVLYDLSSFGGSGTGRAYYNLRVTGSGSTYTMVAAPQPADQVQDLLGALTIPSAVPFTYPGTGQSSILVSLHRPWTSASITHSQVWMFNSYPQSGVSTISTDTFDSFVDEKYRCDRNYGPGPTARILPVGAGVKYDSSVAIAAPVLNVGDLQVVGGRLVYPSVDYSGFKPAGNPDYSAFPAGDPATSLRDYVRLFDTGVPRNTGRIRVKGLSPTAIAAGPFTGSNISDIVSMHPGGACMYIQVLGGGTGALDLGRVKGDPDLTVASQRGCQTSLEVLSPTEFIVSYDTTAYTGNNGFDEYPLYFVVGFTQVAGTGLYIEEIEWLPPV